ncbi:MAG: aminotransferase class V-fold PLP-dependent enzyme [Candidatus Woesearchaeota archaeon]|jgi:cysteine desulfurase|nr:aminotransferase class V-fold PLP-dependent enzyme [Candidatus Woesearchaeota archaeon]
MNKVKKEYYFDNYQLTPISESVKRVIMDELDENILPSHKFIEQGSRAREKVHQAKELIAKSINSKSAEIVFVKEGTTANNQIVRGVVEYHLSKGKNIEDIELIVDSISCPDIYAMHKFYENKGAKIKYINVDSKGNIDLDDLRSKLSKDTVLVSITHINQIIGTIQPINEIGNIVKEFSKDILFNVEAQLSYFKTKIDVEEFKIDFMTISSYKIHGPLISAMYIRSDALIVPILNGRGMGPHEVGFANIPFIVGFKEAVRDKLDSWEKDVKEIKIVRDYALKRISDEITDITIYGPDKDENRDPTNLLVSFKYVEGESVYMDLSFDNIIVNTTSACANENLRADYVILGIGGKHEDSHGSIRFTFSRDNTIEEVDFLVESLKKSVDRIRKLSSFKPEDYDFDSLKKKNAKCITCDAKGNCEVHN